MSQISSREYWAKKGSVDLYMYRKQAGEIVSGRSDKPILFLIHGSSLSAVPGFDLQVPGYDDYSMMDFFARRGFDVWTMDHDGYGKSSRTESNSDVACAVNDLTAAMPVITAETGQTRAMFYGQSGGAVRAAAFAEARPDLVERLILDAYVWTGKDSPTLAKRRERLAEWTGSHRRKVDRAFFHSIFERDVKGLNDPLVAETLADLELAMDDAYPTGTYVDMSANLPMVDPRKILCPVQIIRGEHDGIASDDDLIEFFRLLPNSDKQFCKMAGQAHVGPQATNRHRFLHMMHAFIALPPRRDL